MLPNADIARMFWTEHAIRCQIKSRVSVFHASPDAGIARFPEAKRGMQDMRGVCGGDGLNMGMRLENPFSPAMEKLPVVSFSDGDGRSYD